MSLVVKETENGITTLRMNNPKKYNGWTPSMLASIDESFDWARQNDATKVVILTGTDPYYCAGVDLAGFLKPDHPAKVRRQIYESNVHLFDKFLDFPKPLIAAVNGPAIGASVTSATLCDAIVASERATFNTPFARLGIPPEGCSSVHFENLIGRDNAERILGKEGWVPTAEEAANIGLISECVPHDQLLESAQKLARKWIEEGKTARVHGGSETDTAMLKKVNEAESIALADAFLSSKFLQAQADFLSSKGKRGPSLAFSTLVATRPIWSLMLPPTSSRYN